MDWRNTDLFDLADRRLAWLDRRQQVLASNVANANTPGWRSKDLRPFATLLTGAHDVAMAQTTAGHLPGGRSPTLMSPLVARPRETAPDGNAVPLDDELGRVADTENAHELVSALYHTYLGLYRTALGRGS